MIPLSVPSLALDQGWPRFCRQVGRDALLWLFCLTLLTLYRGLFIATFAHRMMADSTWHTILMAASVGFRFDSKVATIVTLPAFSLSLLSGLFDWERLAQRLRLSMAILFWGSFLPLGRIAIGYYREYDDLFNHWLFGLYYDDTSAIAKTIYAQHHVAREGLAFLVLLALGVTALRWAARRPLGPERLVLSFTGTVPRRILFFLAIAGLVVGGVRGSFGERPMQLKDAAITRDEFLNKAVLNPFVALDYAVSEHLDTIEGEDLGRYLPDKDIGRAIAELTGKDNAVDLDQTLTRTAAGHDGPAPRHIYLIIGESYDAWPLRPRFDALQAMPELKDLIRRGLRVAPFMAGSDGTMSSFVTVVSGLPFPGVLANYQQTSLSPYPTALPHIFSRLGYRTRLFYGGYLSWQNIGDFCRHQGFDEVYGGAHMAPAGSERKEWGVDDERIFAFAEEHMTDDVPSFNLILTTSNHSPYNVDFLAKGFVAPQLPPDLQKLFASPERISHLGHLWYADRCVGDFSRALERKLPATLLAITGDHYGRWYPNERPGFLDRVAVPFVLYGPEVLAGKAPAPGTVGSHHDIAPTLVELTAPAGFPYQALGHNLLAAEPQRLAIERGRALTADYVIDINDEDLYPLAGKGQVANEAQVVAQAVHQHNNLLGVALWRILYGPSLQAAKGSAKP